MESVKVFVLFVIMTLVITTSAFPDSAGIVETVNGLAYGGIPYGSVSGKLRASYERPDARSYFPQEGYQPQPRPRPPSPVVISPNYRAAGVEARKYGPVQIYQLPGVVAPGVLGTFSQIGY